MNYYKRHLGDYAKDTKTLSIYEHGVYTVLLDEYYTTESPLSADDVEALCRPSNAKERASVNKVLVKYFKREGDFWRHSYADRVIAEASEKSEKAAASASKRWGKNMRSHSEGNANASETHSEGNASHKPLANSHEIEASRQAPDIRSEPTPAARACLLMRKAGCVQTNPSHPDLLAAIAEGVDPQALADTAAEGIAAGKPKPFAWAIATARGRHAEGAAVIPPARAGPMQAPSKTTAAVMTLEARKRELRSDPTLVSDCATGRLAEVALLEP